MSRLYPCVYCAEDGYCKKYSDEEVTCWCVQGPCKDERPSNADRIRSMTDEELAEWIMKIADCCGNDYCGKSCPLHTLCWSKSNESTLDWLKEEASN